MSPTAFLVLCAMVFAAQVGLRAEEEEDIMILSKRNPLHITTSAGPALYGDPELADAVNGLADISPPWTVPKIIEIFETERHELSKKMALPTDQRKDMTGDRWLQISQRLGRLATLLASSRDARAGLVLEDVLDRNEHVAFLRSRALSGFYFYFVHNPRYQPVPTKDQFTGFSTNLLREYDREVQVWRKLNDDDLKANAATTGTLKSEN